MILAHLKDEIIWMELMGRSRKLKRRSRRRLVFHLFNNVLFSPVKRCKSQSCISRIWTSYVFPSIVYALEWILLELELGWKKCMADEQGWRQEDWRIQVGRWIRHSFGPGTTRWIIMISWSRKWMASGEQDLKGSWICDITWVRMDDSGHSE
jgi:hypothetical protein